MCGYTGHEFGAGYPDSICCEGYLWDADSDDGEGRLTHGGEWPCPACNTEQMLSEALEEAQSGSCGQNMWRPYCAATRWEAACEKALSVNRPEAEAFLKGVAPFEISDWPDRDAVYAGQAPWDRTIDRPWSPEMALSNSA